MAERKQLPFRLSVKLDSENLAVIVNVINREDAKVLATKTYSAKELPTNIRTACGLYGLSKKLQDSTSDSAETKVADMDEVYARLCKGEWEAQRKAGSPTVSAEVEALAQLKKVDVGTMQKALKDYSEAQREKILSNPQVVELAAKIRASREEQKSSLSLDDMLGEEAA